MYKRQAESGVGDAGFGYGVLIVAMATGAVIGGLGLEAIGGVRPTPRLAVLAGATFALAVLAFALSRSLVLSVAVLVVAGMGNLIANSTAQTIVQLDAPADRRGSFIGAFGVANMGFRTGSGILMASLGVAIGVNNAVALNASILLAIALTLFAVVALRLRRAAAAEPR